MLSKGTEVINIERSELGIPEDYMSVMGLTLFSCTDKRT